MADEPSPELPAAPLALEPVRAASRRWLRWLGGSVTALVVLVALVFVLLWWAVRNATGSAWLVTLVPQLTIVAPRGSLLGDFAAERIDINLPGTSGVLRLDAPRWHSLDASRGDHGRWLHLTIATLHADRVTLLRSPNPAPATNEQSSPPSTLRLPVEIEIQEASVDELRLGAADDAPTLRAVRGRIHLGDQGGTQHRFDALTAMHEQATASGSATIAADAPFEIGARLALASSESTPAWQASASADGPLESLNVAATARVSPSPTHAAQSLDAKAVVRPFAAWPLGELDASTEALDLSAFAGAAPATTLSGHAIASTSGIDRPAVVSIELRNARAGRWNEGLLPVQILSAELRARPDDPRVIDIQTLSAELGSSRLAGGRIVARGRWTPDRWNVDVDVDKVKPSALDARAPDTALDGKAGAVGTGFGSTAAAGARAVELVADLAGQLSDRGLPRAAPRSARLRLEARASENEIDLRNAEASLGGAKATLAGKLHRGAINSPWQATGHATMVDFDPAPWWPGSADSLLTRGANRLNMKGEFDLGLRAAVGAAAIDQLLATRGTAKLLLADSTLAGVPLRGEASFANSDGTARPTFDIVAAGNHVNAQGRISSASAQDSWQLAVDAPQLVRLAPLARAPGSAASAPVIAGTLSATARIDGRWPELKSEGELHGAALRYDNVTVRQAEGRWRLGSASEAAMTGTLALDGMTVSGRDIARVRAQLNGTARAHKAELRVESDALPPEWVDVVAASRTASDVVAGSTLAATPAASAPVAASTAATTQSTGRSAVVLNLEGGLVDSGGERAAGWAGTLHEFVAQGLVAPRRTWLSAHELRGNVFWSGGPTRASLEPGSAELLGATTRWSRIAWQGNDAHGAGAKLEASATIDPLPIAPLLRALQPDFGWGGDLAVGARIDVRGAPTVSVDVVVERARGDLTVTDEIGMQSLGFTDLRLGVAAKDGVWNFTTLVAGSTLGVASGAVTARTSSAAPWPGAATPIEGKLELRVASLGTWGRWVPAGWRLAGELHANASIGGRFGAPEYTGHVEGANLGVRNFLQGVNVKDGSVAIALQGSTARIERFTAKGGSGSVTLQGDASFGTAPEANLKLSADKFEMLGRVDRRIVTSGSASMRLDAKILQLDGTFKVDEGLFDFTRSDAPTLGDDVEVIRRPAGAPPPVATAASAAAAVAAAAPIAPPASRKVSLDLRVAMGEKLRIRGRGLDAGLRGELHLTSPGGRLAVDGTLQAVDGTYQAYGQKLGIDRGVLTFVGPIENPRLDIEATRPNLDVRVGVVVAGTALNPRIRLFSEPDMSDIDKLSWLVLGRASEGVGRADTALLQRAALALLSGEGPGVTDRLTHAIGLDEISVRQQSEGDVKETIVSLGKQISKRWYVGYERGLNATTGSWQLIYRIARRLTVRAQAGGDNSLDLIWTLRWK
jgi:translocation and assembly module TamB